MFFLVLMEEIVFKYLSGILFFIFATLNIYSWSFIFFSASIICLFVTIINFEGFRKRVNTVVLLIGIYSILSLGKFFSTLDLQGADLVTKYIMIPIAFLVLNSCIIITSCIGVYLYSKCYK